MVIKYGKGREGLEGWNKADIDLTKWVERKEKRCGKGVSIVKYYLSNQQSSGYRRYPRAILQVNGEKFTRRLHYASRVWHEVEHGNIEYSY